MHFRKREEFSCLSRQSIHIQHTMLNAFGINFGQFPTFHLHSGFQPSIFLFVAHIYMYIYTYNRNTVQEQNDTYEETKIWD